MSFLCRYGTAILLTMAVSLAYAPGAQAHCDTMDGSVVINAREASKTGHLTPVLKWVRPSDEAAIRQAFEQVLETRAYEDESVEKGRTYVKAYVRYIHYVKTLNQKVTGAALPLKIASASPNR